MLKRFCDVIANHMATIVIIVAVLALFLPTTFSWCPTSWISPMLGLVMFGMGLTLDPYDFKIVFTRPKDILIGSLAQFTIMPFIAYILAKIFGLNDELTIGVILVGCCPGGTASNVITYLAKGDLALSVGMTTVSTVLAPLLTPLLTLALAGARVEVNAWGMFISIIEVVILPIAIGVILQHFWPKQTKQISCYLPAFSSTVIAIIVGSIVASNSSKLLESGLLIILIVILHNICGLTLGYSVGKLLGLELKKRIAISIEVGMQNSGLASSLANLHFALYPMATIPGAIFSVWHNLSGALVAKFYAHQIEK